MKKQLIYLVVGLFATISLASALTGNGLFGWVNFAQSKPSQQQGEIKEFINENGFVELKPTGDKKVFTTGEQEKIDINIAVPEKQVVAFNVPIEYDPAKFEFVGVEVLDSRYNMYIRREGTEHIVLVAAQQATNTDKIFLYKTTVARLIFKVLLDGPSEMAVVSATPKGYLLKLVDEKNEALEPSYGRLNVTSN